MPRHDPSLADLFVEIDPANTGPLAYPGPPYALVEDAARPPVAAPLLGQHNAEVSCQMLGYTREQLVKLYQTGII